MSLYSEAAVGIAGVVMSTGIVLATTFDITSWAQIGFAIGYAIYVTAYTLPKWQERYDDLRKEKDAEIKALHERILELKK